MLERFTKGNPETVRRLNAIVRAVNQLNRMTGDGMVNVSRTPAGLGLTINIHAIQEKIPQSGGGSDIETVSVVRDLKYDDPDREYPTGCTWGTPGNSWPLEDQKYYIVRLESDTTENYNPSTTYGEGDYCLFEVLATTSPMSEAFADIGYGYTLKYKCNAGGTPSPAGAFNYTKWTLVNAYSEGQWKVEYPMQETEAVDMRDYIPWFDVGDELPVFNNGSDHLIWQTFIHTGSDGNKSLSWNQDESRAMAVFR